MQKNINIIIITPMKIKNCTATNIRFVGPTRLIPKNLRQLLPIINLPNKLFAFRVSVKCDVTGIP